MNDDLLEHLRCNPCDCDGTCWACRAADEIERLSAIVTAVDAHISASLAHPARDDIERGYDDACLDILDIIHPEDAR